MYKKALPLTVALFLTLSLASSVLSNKTASAVSASDWKAGRIIDDFIFTDKSAMSVDQIQAFLNSKVGTGGYGRIAGQCDTNGVGTSEFGGGTRAQYGASRGNPAPFTCLKDYYEVPKTSPGPGIPASNYGGAPIPAGARSAAQMIWDAAQRHNISPKVLLVTIQKESAGPLTTDDWPFRKQYTYAMGAHCPDSGPNGSANCDENYAGFSMQIMESARLFRYYLNSMSQSWWPYKRPGNNSVLYNPNRDCGASNVYIETMATAALYTYTPYQPNQAALNNMYGSGDGCSAYGNRNFWRIYSDWFGSTYSPSFNASYDSQSPYPYILTGESKTIYIQYKNNGTAFWKDDLSNFPGYRPVHLATTSPINRGSSFYSGTWLTPSRPNGTFAKVYEADGITLASDQHTVQPGQIARFEFILSVPHDFPPGAYREHFQPILEGAPDYGWNMGGTSFLDIYVVQSNNRASYHSQSSYPSLIGGEDPALVNIKFKNIGNTVWYDDASVPFGKRPVHLATSWPINRGSSFAYNWANPSRPAVNFSSVYEADGTTLAPNQHVVNPGQIAKFEFAMKAPLAKGSGFYQEYFEPVLEGAPGYSWNMNTVAWMGASVTAAINRGAYHSQSPYPTLSAGGAAQPVFFQLHNTGNTKWHDDTSILPGKFPVHLATSWPINRGSNFISNWPFSSRPVVNFTAVYESNGTTPAANQHVVNPGQIARFEFQVKAPAGTTPGFYKEYFDPILEGAPGYSWNMNTTVWMGLNVN